MKIGWIGLGAMGMPMVRHLACGGHEIIIYNRTKSRAAALQCYGCKIANNPAEVCDADIIFTMLWDDQAVEAITFGENGILSASGYKLHVGMSTVSPQFAKRLANAHAEHGQDYISAPVFGRPLAAETAQLGIVVAGQDAAIKRAAELLNLMGTVFITGKNAWKANLIKLTGNFMIGAMLEVLGEAFALIRKSGVDPVRFLNVVNGTVLRSPVYENYGKSIIEEDFSTGGLQIGLKDISFIRDIAVKSGVPMPVAALVQDRLLVGCSRNYAELDWNVLAKIIAEDAGIK